MFSFLSQKTGGPVQAPVLPSSQTPQRWFSAARQSVAPDAASGFKLTGQALKLALGLLSSSDVATQRRGLLLADQSATWVAVHLPGEKWLLARIYEGVIVPHIALAHVERRRMPSRQRLLECAVTAYGNAGEVGRQKAVLAWLLAAGARAPRAGAIQVDGNTLDWARGTLSALLMAPATAPRADLQRALVLLKSIQSPTMTGFAQLRSALETRLTPSPKASSQPTSTSMGGSPTR